MPLWYCGQARCGVALLNGELSLGGGGNTVLVCNWIVWSDLPIDKSLTSPLRIEMTCDLLNVGH